MNEEQLHIHACLLARGFLPADSKSHETIKSFNGDNLLYELTACLIVTWSGELHILYNIIHGFLCIANFYSDGTFSFFIIRPAARHDLQQIVDTLYDIAMEAGLDSLPVWNIEERFLDDYRRLKGYCMKTRYDDGMSEYVYSADSLLNLEGGMNGEKRYQLRKFIDKPNISLQTLSRENITLCLDIENRWCSLQNCDLCRSFAGCSKKSLEIMIDIFDGSVYQGIIGYVDNIPAGYLIFEISNDDIAYIYFIKNVIPNFSMYLYYIAVKRYLNNVRQINNGADLGKQGLQLFKKRLGTHILIRKHLCTFTKEG